MRVPLATLITALRHVFLSVIQSVLYVAKGQITAANLLELLFACLNGQFALLNLALTAFLVFYRLQLLLANSIHASKSLLNLRRGIIQTILHVPLSFL